MTDGGPLADEVEEYAKRTFGQRLRVLRQARGVSQEALADSAGLDRTFVSSCERGRRNLSLVSIYRLAAALEVPPWELLKPGDT